MKKKLLIFHPAIVSYRVDIFNYLCESFDVSIYTQDSSHPNVVYDYNSPLRCLKIKPKKLTKSFKLRGRQFYKGYWKILKEEKPDIVIVSEFNVDALYILAYKKIFRKDFKLISISDDSYHILSSDCDFSIFHKIARKTITPFLDNIIFANMDAKNWYFKNFKKGIFFPIISEESRIRSEYFNALSISKEYVKKYDLNGKAIFIFVGRLVEIKNVHSLILSFIKADLRDAKLIIVGTGNQEEELRSLSLDNPNIIFTGRLSGKYLNAWYNVADALILPSKLEPFGAVTNEALLGGCKVLVSKNAGSNCLVKDGYNGYVIDPNDIEDISFKIQKIYTNLKNPGNFDLSKVRDSMMTEKFQLLYDNLVEAINKS